MVLFVCYFGRNFNYLFIGTDITMIKKIIYTASLILLAFVIVTWFLGTEKIEIDKNYYMFYRGNIVEVNTAKKIEKIILKTYQMVDNINMASNGFFVDNNKIYLAPIFNSNFFEYDRKTKRFSQLVEGNLISYSHKYKKLFYIDHRNLYAIDVVTKKITHIARIEDETIMGFEIVFVTDNEFLFNNKEKVYKYNIDTNQTDTTKITDCKITNIYREKNNSILCLEPKSYKNYMLNLDNYQKTFFPNTNFEKERVSYYDKELDLFFISKLELHLTTNSIERRVTIVYDPNKNKEYLYSEKYTF